MDNSKIITEDFVQLLKKQNIKRPSILYNKVLTTNEQTYKPQKVIETVYSQIKAIQLADCSKSDSKDLNKARKSNFLPVNKLPVYCEVPKPNKFETQCVSNTQLISIIDGAEAINTHTGMTQEFDTTFTHIDDKNSENPKHDKEIEESPDLLSDDVKKHNETSNFKNDATNHAKSCHSSKEIIVNQENDNKIDCNFTNESNNDKDLQKSTEIKIHNTILKENQPPDISSQISETATDDTITFVDNVPSSSNANNDPIEIDINAGQDSQIFLSPVFNINARQKKSRTPSPLIVPLESFENFENMAIPILEENAEFETAKHLINSQILGRELCLHTDTNVMFDIQRNYSPILEFKSDELQINSQDLKKLAKKEILDNIVALNDIKSVTDKHSDILADEILFSSDEENDYVHKDLQDLPLTCALETSFYDQTGILEKTMYVGFQTASNKSIQICTDSFNKAQSILEDSNKTVNAFSLTELVEKCEKNINSTAMSVKANETSTNAVETKSDLISDKESKEGKRMSDKDQTEVCNRSYDVKKEEKKICNGFMTASYKEINMSKKAFERCQNVFKDIDLNEDFVIVEDPGKKDCNTEIKPGSDNRVQKADDNKSVEENTNDDKINDELLLQEFENIEMSLEEKETSFEQQVLKDTGFEGFKTASNKNIKISEEAMIKTKNIFQDIAIEQEVGGTESTLIRSENITSFKTASEKIMNTTAFAKANNVFQDIKSNEEVDISEYINQPSTSKAVFVGFKTASNKNIKISDEALSKTKNIFKDLDEEKTVIEAIEDTNQPSTSKAVFVGFKTANNMDIKISDEAFSKTKNIFKDLDEEIPATEPIEGINQPSTSKPLFVGFKTASNKDIKISNDDLLKYKNIFKDIDETISTYSEVEEKELSTGLNMADNKVKTFNAESKKGYQDIDIGKTSYAEGKIYENPMSKGFQTASKKPVIISADALAKSKQILQDIDEVNESLPETSSNNISNVVFKGFETANKKPIDVSEDAVIASKKLLDNLNDNQRRNSKNDFVAFKTASNKDVNISNDALARCRKIFDDIENIPIVQDQSQSATPQWKDHIFKGFQTANNKKVEISKEALEKTKNLFEDFGSSTKIDTRASYGGFQTANNMKVTISEQALAKSRQLFHDLDVETDVIINNKDKTNTSSSCYEKLTERIEAKNPKKNNFGFITGNNEKIDVSEDALEKSKKLLAEDTISEEKKYLTKESKYDSCKDLESKKDSIVNLDSILNTQVLNNFEENLCTEDFKDTPRPNKRSGSPILSCPKAKKRKKFETPYKSNAKIVIDFNKDTDEVTKAVNAITVKEHYKKNKLYTLNDLANFENGKNKTIDPYILNFNLDNILNFEFTGGRNDMQDGKLTIEEVKQLFIEASDKKLIPDGWMDIHLKLILWKLISYEIQFLNTLGTVCTVKNVINQLKYRYDRELYNAERPVLRKILEKDDVPTKTMVLCVAGIYIDGVSVTSATNLANIELLLTDGWYFIKATIDKMLSKLVYDGKIIVGCKIMTCGAELVNCEQGVAPWEDTSAIRLNISGNSTRPVHPHARLGLRPAPPPVLLAAVRADGGRVLRLRVRVARVYPLLYVEKFRDGSTVTRSERLEHQYQIKYEAEREDMIEKIYEEVEKELSDQESQDSELDSGGKRKTYNSGSQIAKHMKISKDPMEFRAHLTSSQAQMLQEHTCKQRDKHLQAIQNRVQEKLVPRTVVALARTRVADLRREGDRIVVTKGMLSIWKPSDEVLEIFKEGFMIEVMNVVPTGVRNSEIQLSAGRQSVFRPVKCKEDEIFKPYLESLKRKCYNIKDLSQNPSMTTDYNEIDTVGLIFSIDPSNREFESIKNQFQNLYLADIDKNVICVNFWGGIKKFGFENILDTGQVIFCGNLQRRAGNTRKNIPQYRATEFSLFTKTPKNKNARDMVEEFNKKMFGLDRRKFCEDCITVKQNYSVIKCISDSENVSPYRFNNSAYNLVRNKIFIDTPIGVKVNKGKSEDFNLTGLDFESTFKQQDSQELSPQALLRKKKVNEKIARLKMYGEPPPLSPMNIINKSKNAANSYKSPLLSKSDSVAPSVTSVNNLQNVATPTKLPKECSKSAASGLKESSPIISMNRTYVKRSVNPVKLNFSESAVKQKNDESIDHFAEEFDGSPPLSLD